MSEPAGIEQELWLADPNLRGNMFQDILPGMRRKTELPVIEDKQWELICEEDGCPHVWEECWSCEFGCMPVDHGEFEYGDPDDRDR